MDLTGPEFVDLLKQQEYEWDSSQQIYQRIYDGASYAAANKSGAWGQSDYTKATDKGAVASVIAANVVGGYENSQKALEGNAHCVIEDSYFNADGTGIAIVYGSTMEEHLILIRPAGENLVELDIYSKQAVASGLLDQVVGRQMGGSFNEVWKTVTGKDSYGH